MNRIIFLLAVLTFASCSRIVTKDYELLDSGTVAEIDNVEGKMGIASNRDGVCREWFPETMRDGLSVWGICYADSLAVGDKCYVYAGGEKPVISKVSVADAQRINRALCRQYWKELLISERLIVCVLMALATMAFWLFSPNSGKCIGVGFVLILATTAAAVAWMAPALLPAWRKSGLRWMARRFITFLCQKTFSTAKRLRPERRSMSIVTASTVREFAKISF